MLLGLMVIMLLGSYLYQSISNGLEEDRIASATLEASRLATEAQQAFDATDSTESAAQLGLFARDLVQQKLASPGADTSRQVVLHAGARQHQQDVRGNRLLGRGVPPQPSRGSARGGQRRTRDGSSTS